MWFWWTYFWALPEEKEPLDHLFTDDRDWAASVGAIAEDAPDIAHVKALRPRLQKPSGPKCPETLRTELTWYFWLFTERTERTARFRPSSI